MNREKISILVILLLLVSVLFAGCKPWTIVKNGDKNEKGTAHKFQGNTFDADSFVRDIWDNQLFAYYEDKQKDIKQVTEDMKKDVNAAGESYGFGSGSVGCSWSFVVNGKGTVLSVNTESRVGIMEVDLEPYDQKADIVLQIGPIINGTAVRDTIDTIKLDDVENQVQFASISKGFNKIVLSDVIGKVDLTSLTGKEIQFLGAFQYTSPDEIIITPVKLEVEGGQ